MAIPLIIGVGENEYYAASDVPAIIKHTNKAYSLSLYALFYNIS